MIDRDILYLTHIMESIEAITEYTSGGRDAFLHSRLIRDAVIRNFEIIGKASVRLSDRITQNSTIPWRRIKDFRNLLAHEYAGVNMGIVWDVIEKELPPLDAEVRTRLAALNAL